MLDYIQVASNQVIPTGEQDFCVVCQTTNVPYEQHHVVPRHLGGTDGPQINICGGCHQLIHNGALALHAGRQIPELDPSWSKIKRIRYMYLVRVIVNAMIAADGESGKNWKYQTTFSDACHTKLVKLAKLYGSQDKAILAAIDKLHQAHFGS